jgi:DNA-binding NtrC family response regulator
MLRLADSSVEENRLTHAPSWRIDREFEGTPQTSEAARPRLLVVDDDTSVLSLIERVAVQWGFDVVVQSDAREALLQVQAVKPHVVLVDLRMPEIDGLDILRMIRERHDTCQVVLMTGAGSIDTAVEAVKLGALDYLTKPFDFQRLREILTTVRMDIERRERLLQVDADVARKFEFHHMIGRSPAMQQLFDMLRRVAPHARTVLITGETGTGKELVARALHKLGPRRDRRLVTVNCSAVVDTLSESELFGHVRGAFTGATQNKEGLFDYADNGTLFLDEVGELPLTTQAKLLRAVDLGEVQRVGAVDTKHCDVHVIAATNRDLFAESTAGRFRNDLFYRLGVLNLRLTPLRDRREDIPYLTAAFLAEFGHRLDRRLSGITSGAERLLQQAQWPGNVRELRNVVERACIMSEGGILSEREISQAMSTTMSPRPGPVAELPQSANEGVAAHDPNLLTTAYRAQIERVLAETHGNKTAAAQMLGISRRSLYRWIDRLQVAARPVLVTQ